MRTGIILALVSVSCLVAMEVAATDPYYVYRDIDLLGNAVDSPNCDDDGASSNAYPCKSYLGNLPAQSHFRPTRSQVRLPQFWDGSPILFAFKTRLGNWFSDDDEFPAELPSRLTIQLRDPDTGDLVATASSDFGAALRVTQDVSGTMSDVQFLIPGKLYGVSVVVGETESMVISEFFQVAGLYLKVPVILPFIFENGFEEGQAAFWSELYGY